MQVRVELRLLPLRGEILGIRVAVLVAFVGLALGMSMADAGHGERCRKGSRRRGKDWLAEGERYTLAGIV